MTPRLLLFGLTLVAFGLVCYGCGLYRGQVLGLRSAIRHRLRQRAVRRRLWQRHRHRLAAREPP